MEKSLMPIYEQYRNNIISYVYRLTGSMQEAEDITQETFIKYLNQKESDIKNTKAWLFKVATNLALDFFRSAKNKKESYIGPWLPEPYIQESQMYDEIELDESLSMALLVLLEKLSTKERTAYILHDIFEFKHKEIAQILNISTQNSRQLTSRANKKLQNKKKNFSSSKEEHIKLTNSFLKAIKEGNLEELKDMFKEDIKLIADGGGKATAVRKIIYGDNEFVSNFLIKVTSYLLNPSRKDVQTKTIWFNGSLGILLIEDGIVKTSFSFEIKDNKISSIFTLRNPDKLKFFNI